jgi:SAM-dependent methyltransferase
MVQEFDGRIVSETMHDTALEFGQAFFEIYLPSGGGTILEVGALDVNGSLRALAPLRATYLGVDMIAGEGVDQVLSDPHHLPFPDWTFDAVVATSCFEHDPMFWVTFLEIARVTRLNGYIYINSPSNGWFHQHPRDNWRFYPDAALSLRDWAQREGLEVTLVESFIGRRRRSGAG